MRRRWRTRTPTWGHASLNTMRRSTNSATQRRRATPFAFTSGTASQPSHSYLQASQHYVNRGFHRRAIRSPSADSDAGNGDCRHGRPALPSTARSMGVPRNIGGTRDTFANRHGRARLATGRRACEIWGSQRSGVFTQRRPLARLCFWSPEARRVFGARGPQLARPAHDIILNFLAFIESELKNGGRTHPFHHQA
jgi:hypothetical protein